MNDGLLALLGRIVDSFGEKARCSDGDDHRAAIERSADDLIAINLQDAGIVLNPGFLLCVCHGDALWFCFRYTLVDARWFEQAGEAARMDKINRAMWRYRRFFGVPAWLSIQCPNWRASRPSGSILASSRSRLWPHKEYWLADSVTLLLYSSNARVLL
jgi:hypothetical protein